MRRVIIIGAGGHAQVIADILLHSAQSKCMAALIGFVDDNPDLRGKYRLGMPILGSVMDLNRLAFDCALIGIGNNRIRHNIFSALAAQGHQLSHAVHDSAVIAEGVNVSTGSVISAGSIVNTGTYLGQNVILNTSCTVDHHNRIGAHVHIGPGANLGGDVVVGEGALIGIGAAILPQLEVGAWAVIGAGAVVTQNVPDRAVVAGVPARIIGWNEE